MKDPQDADGGPSLPSESRNPANALVDSGPGVRTEAQDQADAESDPEWPSESRDPEDALAEGDPGVRTEAHNRSGANDEPDVRTESGDSADAFSDREPVVRKDSRDAADAFADGDPGAIALARSRAYTLFAHFVRHGVTAASREAGLSLPELAPMIEGRDLEAMAADHHDLFRHQVFPWASVFLESSGQPGAEVTAAFYGAHARLGWRPESEEADHLASVLDALAFAWAAEWEARRDGQAFDVPRIEEARRRFVAEALLGWWPGLATAVEAEGHPFFTELMRLVGALVDTEESHSFSWQAPLAASLDEVLAGAESGLRDIAQHLTAFARSGFYLSRGALDRLGRGLDLPRGFGSRADRLETLMAAAAAHGRWQELCERLLVLSVEQQARVQAWSVPEVGEAWSSVQQATQTGLNRLREAPQRTV